jgi:predicted AAA+ superfamily ATPase
MEIIELWPFSQGEMSEGPDRFIDAAFRHGPRLAHFSTSRRKDYLERVVVGGFPEVVRRTPRRRAAFFDSYLSMLIERDVLEVSNIERRGDLLKLLALLAGRAGQMLVPAALSSQSGIPRTTRSLAHALGERFVAGFVLYTGPQTLPFGDKIRAVPLDALWRVTP